MSEIEQIIRQLQVGNIIPYLGPGIWDAASPPPEHPASQATLAGRLTERVTVPHRIRNNLTAAAQYIENFKHRKTLVDLMNGAFASAAQPLPLHRFLASLDLPLIVDAWYSDAMQQALGQKTNWGQVQAVSQAEHHGQWVRHYQANGEPAQSDSANQWQTLLYCPLGSRTPAQNYIVSDSDYVEILTEIDIQTPIPPQVQQIRAGRNFLFLGCRFTNQLERIFARQIIKRSGDRHWAVIEGDLSRNEKRFLDELNIARIDLPLAEAVAQLTKSGQ